MQTRSILAALGVTALVVVGIEVVALAATGEPLLLRAQAPESPTLSGGPALTASCRCVGPGPS